jgi:hypothetical protein
MLQVFLAEGEYHYVGASAVSEIFLSSKVVLSIRTWAVWRANRVIGIGLTVLMLAYFGLQCFAVQKFVSVLAGKSQVVSLPCMT